MQLAAMATCLAVFANPHPHVIRDAPDAISTAYADWSSTYAGAHSDREFSMWKSNYGARQEGGVWILSPYPRGARYPGQGTHIRLDGKTGCMVSEVSFD